VVQGKVVAWDLDVFNEVGQNTAYIVEVTVPATDSVVIALLPVKENPMISAIEIVQESGTMPTTPAPVVAPTTPAPMVAPITPAPVVAPTTPAPVVVQTGGPSADILINVGGGIYTENAGVRTWEADKYFTGGTARNFPGVAFDNTLDDKVYQTERSGDFTYAVPVPPGDYEIIVHLAEVSNTIDLAMQTEHCLDSEHYSHSSFSTFLCSRPSSLSLAGVFLLWL